MKKPTGRTEKKTPGTMAVEKYRPKMNKLTHAERSQLLAQAFADIAVPQDFIEALDDFDQGRFVSMKTALYDVPPGA